MHTRTMELRSIGGYTLVEPLSTQRSTAQFYLTRSLGDPDRERARKAMQAMMTMVKIDTAELERACKA